MIYEVYYIPHVILLCVMLKIWSHVTDDYLLTMGTKNASFKFLLECYTITHTYKITRLADAYAKILMKNYLNSAENLVKVLHILYSILYYTVYTMLYYCICYTLIYCTIDL